MMHKKIMLIGDIVVDVSLKTTTTDIKLRLGGIVHSARCLWALDVPFAVGYFAPKYLDTQIVEYLNSLGCKEISKLGEVTGAPYIFLIDDVKEVGAQGYEFLLRDELQIEYNVDAFACLNNFENFLLISGNYDLPKICNALKGNIFIDLANNVSSYKVFENFTVKFNTIFLSTSSDIFTKFYSGNFDEFANSFSRYTNVLLLKENRGGCRGVDFSNGISFSSASQTKPILHSVGVGDIYDTVYSVLSNSKSHHAAAVFSSWIAAEYAITTFPDDFKRGATRVLASSIEDLTNLGGVKLPWEQRSNINIYIAAPDFDFVDIGPIDRLSSALTYHNFKPRRPVKENGQMDQNASKAKRQELFNKDMVLLGECSILIAVLLFNDPGTLIEIGLAAAQKMPTFVFDPYGIATNCMLTEIPTLISSDLDEVISETFIQSFKLLYGK